MKYICMNWIDGDEGHNKAAQRALLRAQADFLTSPVGRRSPIPLQGMTFGGFVAGSQSSFDQFVVVDNRRFVQFIESADSKYWPIEIIEAQEVVLLQPNWLKNSFQRSYAFV